MSGFRPRCLILQTGRHGDQTMLLLRLYRIVIHLGMSVTWQRLHLSVLIDEIDGGIYSLHLLIFRGGLTSGAHHALDTESLQVGRILKVTAIDRHTHRQEGEALVELVGDDNTLVGPLPDKTAQHTWMTVDLIPVLLEITQGITHHMGILTGKYRTVIRSLTGDRQQSFPPGILRTLHIIILHTGIQVFILRTGIEAGDDIHIGRVVMVRTLCTLVMNEACRIILMNPCGSHGEVGSPPCLIAKTPEDHTGMVAVTDHCPLCTVHPGSCP